MIQIENTFAIGDADIRNVETVRHELGEAEKAVLSQELTELSIKVNRIEDRKKEVMVTFKLELDPLKLRMREICDNLDSGFEDKEQELSGIKNFSTNMMEMYDDDGAFVSQRPLSQEERQIQIRI